MTHNADVELLPCPFCGEVPSYPDGIGTQYEIWCDCGMACSCVQISDLMTIEERIADRFKDYKYGEKYVERAKREVTLRWNERMPPNAEVTRPVSDAKKCADGKRVALKEGLEAIAYVLFLETWLDEGEGLTELSDDLLKILGKKWQEEWLPERNAEHYGDCTKQSGACIRCVLDDLYANAQRIFDSNAKLTSPSDKGGKQSGDELSHWKKCYKKLWELKIAFEEENDGRVSFPIPINNPVVRT